MIVVVIFEGDFEIVEVRFCFDIFGPRTLLVKAKETQGAKDSENRDDNQNLDEGKGFFDKHRSI